MRPSRQLAFAVLAFMLLSINAQQAYPCSWAIGYFHQVTCLRGEVVGTSRGWPRWIRQRISRPNVRLRLYEYRFPVSKRSDMPLVKTVTTDENGRFDFGSVADGHYTLMVDWPADDANPFDVEIKQKLPRRTASVKIDATWHYPDCTGGHEFIVVLQ